MADEEQILGAIRAYAAAVEARSPERLRRAYPGITAAEVRRWEQLFREAEPGTLRVTHEIEQPRVDGRRGHAHFSMVLRYTDTAGQPVGFPIPLRAVLVRGEAGWRLEEVRNISGTPTF